MAFSTYTPALYPNLRQQTFTGRQLVSMPFNGLLRIERGAVRAVTWSEQGTAITLGYWGVGDVLGKSLSGVQSYQIECKTHVEVSYIPQNLCYQSLDEIFRHFQETQAFFCVLRTESLRDRLLQLLAWLGQKFGREVEQGVLIDLRLTRTRLTDDSAEQIGELLRSNSTVKFISLDSNLLGDRGMKSLCHALHDNGVLQAFNIGRNQISDASLDDLLLLLRSNRIFDRLDLGRNRLTEGSKQTLRQLNTEQKNIKTFIL